MSERPSTAMRVMELWRYPVKSLAGERVQAANLTRDGVPGDRIVQVRDAAGRTITSRTRHRLLGLKAVYGHDGEPLIDGHPWRSPEAASAVREAAGKGARLVRDPRPDRFDVLPLLVATDGALEQLGVDWRRLRPNIVIGGVEGLGERSWPGRRLRAGGAMSLHIASPVVHPQRLRVGIANLRAVFSHVRPYLVAVPLYGTLWAMACASTDLDPALLTAAEVQERLHARRIGDLKYYNGETHRGMLGLPNFVRDLLSDVDKT